MFEKGISTNLYSSINCCVNVAGREVYRFSGGNLSKESSTITTRETIYDLASVTKTITAVIVLRAITKGMFALHSTIEQVISNVGGSNRFKQITIRELLTHTSGLVAWFPFYSLNRNSKEFMEIVANDCMLRDDNEVVYSDLNYMILGEILSHQYKDSLENIVENELAMPLHLKSLMYNPGVSLPIAATEYGNQIEMGMCAKRGVTFESWRDTKLPITGSVNDGNAYYYWKGIAGHAGLFANMDDLTIFCSLLLDGNDHHDCEFIGSEYLKLIHYPVVGDRTLGFECSHIYPEGFGHTGFTGTAIWVEPKRGITVTLLTNRLHAEVPVNIQSFRKEVFGHIYDFVK